MIECAREVADLVVSATVKDAVQGPARLVELSGEADVTSWQLEDVLGAEVVGRPPLLVVDLSRLTFIDAWALRVILAVGERLRRAGGVLALAGPSGEVRRLIELFRADRLVPVHSNVREASPAGNPLASTSPGQLSGRA
jgi:anti-anti-sigma factor